MKKFPEKPSNTVIQYMLRSVVSRVSIRLTHFSFVRYVSGHVKSFNDKKGFGFIHPEFALQNEIIKYYGSWKDVFVHYSDIDDEVKLLQPTTKVEFDCTFEDQGPVARHVKKIIPKRNRMVAEKWLDCPDDIDIVVQKKEELDSQMWFKYMREYYRTLSQNKQRWKTGKSPKRKDSDYQTMLNDLLTGLDRISLSEKKKNS